MHDGRGEPARANRHDAVRARELHRVRDQVVEDLFELRVIGLDVAGVVGDVDVESDMLPRRHAAHDLADAFDRGAHAERLRKNLHLPRFDFRQIENVVDDREEMLA